MDIKELFYIKIKNERQTILPILMQTNCFISFIEKYKKMTEFLNFKEEDNDGLTGLDLAILVHEGDLKQRILNKYFEKEIQNHEYLKDRKGQIKEQIIGK